MREDIVKKLNREFAREQVKSRKGPSGKRLDYIEAHAVIARLNEALDADWSFEVVEHRVLDNEVLVLGKLTVHTEPVVSKTAFGSQVIKRYEQSQEVISLGDDLKAAASDALKKAATLLGVGLHLYGRDGARTNGHASNGNGQHHSPRPVGNPRDPWLRAPGANGTNGNGHDKGGNGASNGNGHKDHPANGNGVTIRDPSSPLSLAQMKAIFRIGKMAGLNNNTIKQMVKERFGKEVVDQLTKQEASDLISSLKQ